MSDHLTFSPHYRSATTSSWLAQGIHACAHSKFHQAILEVGPLSPVQKVARFLMCTFKIPSGHPGSGTAQPSIEGCQISEAPQRLAGLVHIQSQRNLLVTNGHPLRSVHPRSIRQLPLHRLRWIRPIRARQ